MVATTLVLDWRHDPADEWVEQALCAQTDPGTFFPEKGGSVRAAVAVCSRCPVRAECLEAALARDDRFGIWGGTSAQQRKALRHARQRRPATPTSED